MTIARVKHINQVRGRDGRVRHYHRKTGERLPDDQAARIARAIEINAELAARPASRSAPGTFDDLVERFLQSPDFAERADETRRKYRAHAEAIRARWGELPVKGLAEKHVKLLRDAHAHAPRQANQRLSLLSVLLDFGRLEDGALFGRANPAKHFPRLRERPRGAPESWPPWPDEILAAFLEAEATYPELAWNVILRLSTGQRGQDCHTMLWGQYDGRVLRLVPAKTDRPDEPLVVPAHPALRELLDVTIPAALGAAPHPHRPILLTAGGRPWRGNWFDREVARVMAAIDAPKGRYVPHGLRKNAVVWLLESGCSEAEVQAITGQSRRMVRHYGRGLRRARLAEAAIAKVAGDAPGGLKLQNKGPKTAKQGQET